MEGLGRHNDNNGESLLLGCEGFHENGEGVVFAATGAIVHFLVARGIYRSSQLSPVAHLNIVTTSFPYKTPWGFKD